MKKIISMMMFILMMISLIGCTEDEVIIKFEVSFESNGGSMIESIEVVENSLLTQPTNPIREEYTFEGWFEDQELTIPWVFETNTVTKDITLYAKWEIIPPTSFTVTYQTNDGSPIDSEIVLPSALLTNKTPTKTDKIFAGWYQESKFRNLWDFGYHTVNANMTLYAKWKDPINFNQTFKVLSIGNSFSQDAHRYLWEIAQSYGIPEENIVVANMYYGGAQLSQHVNYADSDDPVYEYQKFTSKDVVNTMNNLGNAIMDEDWDVVTIQQASHYSGLEQHYQDYVRRMVKWIESWATNPNVIIGWHMTWAYQQDSTHSGFGFYGNNQLNMYGKIVDLLDIKIKTLPQINLIIPSGTAIQNARTSFVGDTLTRDGFHLSDPLGRYIAGLMYFKSITGFEVSPTTITFKPEGVSEALQLLAMEVVNQAYLEPYQVTQSMYTEVPNQT